MIGVFFAFLLIITRYFYILWFLTIIQIKQTHRTIKTNEQVSFTRLHFKGPQAEKVVKRRKRGYKKEKFGHASECLF